MTLPRLEAFIKRWERIPPPSVCIAGIAQALGLERPAAHNPSAGRAQATQGLLELATAMGFSTEKPAWLQEAEATQT